MKKGFTLIELLAVIVILAIIALIATPIVLNIIEESRDNANKRSIDLYAKTVENAIVRYRLKENKAAKSYEDIKDYIEYSGAKVECDTFIIHDDSTLYLGSCKVNEVLVKKYSYGTTTLGEAVLSNYGGKDKITSITDFTQVSTGLYKLEDDYGTSYYLRGNITDNYVLFGKTKESTVMTKADGLETLYDSMKSCISELSQIGAEDACKEHGSEAGLDMYWRIVRINGDGTTRLIYDGTEITSNGENNYDNFITTTAYSTIHPYASYNDSDAKKVLDRWYTYNLENEYGNYIADSIFCNDTTVGEYTYYDENWNKLPDGQTSECFDMLYSPSVRSANNIPQLTCTKDSDKYTVNNNYGNGLLSKPIGLITQDEVILAGRDTKNSYLYSYEPSWTMSPRSSNSVNLNIPYTYIIGPGDAISFDNNTGDYTGIRPVINLKADVEFTGSGTLDDPYVLATE